MSAEWMLPLLWAMGGALLAVGIAWGTLVTQMKALTKEIHELRIDTQERVRDHETRLREVESTVTAYGAQLTHLEVGMNIR